MQTIGQSEIRRFQRAVFYVTAVISVVFGLSASALAAELKILAGGPARAVLEKWAPEYTASTGVKLKLTFGTVAKSKSRLAAGELADVVFLTAEALEGFEKGGKIRAGSRVKVGRVGLGIASKAGAAKPDVATPDALRDALMAAPVVGYPDSKTVTGRLFVEMLEQMGIAGEVRQKGREFSSAPNVMKFLAQGGGDELGFAPMSVIAGARTKGVQLVGAVPSSLQHYAYYEMGITANSQMLDEANAVLKALTSPSGQAYFTAAGYEVD
jgi:molybdate transport system substrate-binding protein